MAGSSDIRELKGVLKLLLIGQLALWTIPLMLFPGIYAKALGLPASVQFWPQILAAVSLGLSIGVFSAVRNPEQNLGTVRMAMWIHLFVMVVFAYYVARNVLTPLGSAFALAHAGFAIALYAALKPWAESPAKPEETEEETPEESALLDLEKREEIRQRWYQSEGIQ